MPTARKHLEVLAFVAVWMASGWLFHLDANAYLLLGVPLVVLFQLGVRRQPLQNLWVRDGAPLRLDRIGIALAALLMVVPLYEVAVVALPQRRWGMVWWLLCACVGAVGAAFTMRYQQPSAVRRGLAGFIATVLIGIGIMTASVWGQHQSVAVSVSTLASLLKQFLLYFVVSFVLEEVAFRGALDAHVYQPGHDEQSRPWLSAVFISALWGLWHLPTMPLSSGAELAAAVPAVMVFPILVGVPLAFCWRASGALALPATAHALIDAYRNIVY